MATLDINAAKQAGYSDEEIHSYLAQNPDVKPPEGIPFGKAIPTSLSILGGLAGSVFGPPGAIGGATAGAIGGEGIRQALSQVASRPVQHPVQQMGLEALLGAGSEAGGQALGLAGHALSGTAGRLYKSVLKPSLDLADQGVVQTGLKESIPISEKGLSQVGGLISDLNDEIAGTIKAAGKEGATIDSTKVLSRLDDLKKFFGNTVLGQSLNEDINKVADQFLAAHGQEIPIEQAQAIKQNTGVLLRKMYGELSGPTSEATKAVVRGLKEEIANQLPAVDTMNARESKLFPLEEALSKAVHRDTNKNAVSMSTILGGIGGSVASGGSPIGPAVGAGLLNRLSDPATVSKMAIALNKAGGKVGGQPARQGAAAIMNLLAHGIAHLLGQ